VQKAPEPSADTLEAPPLSQSHDAPL